MLFFKCTQEVQRFWKLPLEPAPRRADNDSLLGGWYLNFFTADRRKMLIFLSESTQLSFVTLCPKKSHAKKLHQVFIRGLVQTLQLHGVPLAHIDRILHDYVNFSFAKTDNRVTLGCLVELVKNYQHFVLEGGGLAHVDIGSLIRRENESLQRTAEWRTPIEAVRDVLRAHVPIPPPIPQDDIPPTFRFN
jgi:hypothetical protein